MDFMVFLLSTIFLAAITEAFSGDDLHEPLDFSTALKKYASRQHRSSASDSLVTSNARTFVASLTPANFGRFGWETWQLSIGLGTPPQPLNVTITYGTVNMFVMSKGYTEQACRGPTASRHTFSLNETTTVFEGFAGEDLLLIEPYADVSDCGTLNATGWSEGSQYYDNMTIGGESISQVSFFSMDTAQHFNPQWASDGLIGLDFDFGCIFGDDGGCTMLDILLHLMDNENDTKSEVVSVYLPSSGSSDANGQIVFGSLQNHKCSSRWHWMPKFMSIASDGMSSTFPGWNVEVKGVSLGTYSTGNISQIGAILAESAFIWAPKNIFSGIVSALRAKYSYKQKQYVVPCAAVSRLPDMLFQLNGTERAIPAKEYTRQAAGDAKTCVLLVKDVSTAQGQFGSLLLPPLYAMNNYWVLGSSFLRGSCHALNFGNLYGSLFGFASAA